MFELLENKFILDTIIAEIVKEQKMVYAVDGNCLRGLISHSSFRELKSFIEFANSKKHKIEVFHLNLLLGLETLETLQEVA